MKLCMWKLSSPVQRRELTNTTCWHPSWFGCACPYFTQGSKFIKDELVHTARWAPSLEGKWHRESLILHSGVDFGSYALSGHVKFSNIPHQSGIWKPLEWFLMNPRIYTQTSAEDHKAERELFEKSLCGFKTAQWEELPRRCYLDDFLRGLPEVLVSYQCRDSEIFGYKLLH